EIEATSWGEEFSDDEVTPGKVTILNGSEEESDWDDDKRSSRKNLVIQEKLVQNQQDFLDEYLPQWDDHLATQKQESELEWENPFAAKRGEDHTMLHLSKEEENNNNNNNDFPYPKFRNFKKVAAQIIKQHEEHVFPSTSQEESTQSYQPPHDSIMGPSVYPPAQQNPQPFYRPEYQFGYPKGKDPGLWSEVISRWESITINRLKNITWSDNKAKLAFVENILGESEKLMWQQLRTVFPEAYSALEAIADEPQNITSLVRQLILLEDPYRGSTDEQERAYRDLDRITCEETKNLGLIRGVICKLCSSNVDEDTTSRLWPQLQQNTVVLRLSVCHSNLMQPRTALPTEYQLADMFTKALPEDRFKYLARRIDSIHVVTSVSRHHKRTREDVSPMLEPSETLPLKRTRGSTGTSGGR
nr:TPA: orf y [Tanacetum cinerariifolium]